MPTYAHTRTHTRLPTRAGSPPCRSRLAQAHEQAVRAMVFSHSENWLLTGDDAGVIKYWKPNLELVKSAPAHKEALRGIAFAPSDLKFATVSDDSTVKASALRMRRVWVFRPLLWMGSWASRVGRNACDPSSAAAMALIIPRRHSLGQTLIGVGWSRVVLPT